MAVWWFPTVRFAICLTCFDASGVASPVGLAVWESIEISDGLFLLQTGFGVHRRLAFGDSSDFLANSEHPWSFTSSLVRQAWDTAVHTNKVTRARAANASNTSDASSEDNATNGTGAGVGDNVSSSNSTNDSGTLPQPSNATLPAENRSAQDFNVTTFNQSIPNASGNASMSNIASNMSAARSSDVVSNATVSVGNSTNSTMVPVAVNSTSPLDVGNVSTDQTTVEANADIHDMPDVMGWPRNVALMGCCFTVEDGWELGTFCCLRAWPSSKHTCGGNVSDSKADVGWNFASCPSSDAEAGAWILAMGPYHADGQAPFREDSHDSRAPLARSSFRHPAYAGDEDPLVPIVHHGGAVDGGATTGA